MRHDRQTALRRDILALFDADGDTLSLDQIKRYTVNRAVSPATVVGAVHQLVARGDLEITGNRRLRRRVGGQ